MKKFILTLTGLMLILYSLYKAAGLLENTNKFTSFEAGSIVAYVLFFVLGWVLISKS